MASLNSEVFSAVQVGAQALKVNQQDVNQIDDVMGEVQEQVALLSFQWLKADCPL